MTGKTYGIQAPQFQAMDPDRLQTGLAQIAYGGNPIAAGLALSGENIAHDMRTNQYLDQLRQSNALAAALAEKGMSTDLATTALNTADKRLALGVNDPFTSRILGLPDSDPLENLAAIRMPVIKGVSEVTKNRAEASKALADTRTAGGMLSQDQMNPLGLVVTEPSASSKQLEGALANASAIATTTNKVTEDKGWEVNGNPKTWSPQQRDALVKAEAGDAEARAALIRAGLIKVQGKSGAAQTDKGPQKEGSNKTTTAIPDPTTMPPPYVTEYQLKTKRPVVYSPSQKIYVDKETGQPLPQATAR